MRLIDADALDEVLEKIPAADIKNIDGQAYILVQLSQVFSVIKNAPTIEPERKVGEWIDQKGGGCCCSACGRYALDEVDGNFIHVAAKSNYCPNCGVKMKEGDQDAR